jgi:GWxTD domain-containing protein
VDRVEFERRFWKENDPDLATPENEAQLEYWSRVTQAYFLFFDHRRREWDQRGEIYVRYGPPRLRDYNPIGARTRFQMGFYGNYPMNALVWTYPELGMTVVMQDRTLNEFYLKEHSLWYDTDPTPDPDSLDSIERDRVAIRGGRGVFPKLPPGVRPLPVDGVLARFVGEGGPRLMALLQAPGTPADSLWADWVVLDTAQVEIARGRRALSPSACDPSDLRVADFISDLPPGRYSAGLSVSDGRGRRGLFKQDVELEAAHAGLARRRARHRGPAALDPAPGQPRRDGERSRAAHRLLRGLPSAA